MARKIGPTYYRPTPDLLAHGIQVFSVEAQKASQWGFEQWTLTKPVRADTGGEPGTCSPWSSGAVKVWPEEEL